MSAKDDRYNTSPAGKARVQRYDKERRAGGNTRPSGPRPPDDNARRTARGQTPEYRLARRLGVTVATARKILETTTAP